MKMGKICNVPSKSDVQFFYQNFLGIAIDILGIAIAIQTLAKISSAEKIMSKGYGYGKNLKTINCFSWLSSINLFG